VDFKQESFEKLLSIGGPTLVCRVVDLFFEHVPPKLTQLNQHVSAVDFGELERTAHSIKSSAANLGLENLRQLAQDLEKTANGKTDLAVCTQLTQDLQAAYATAAELLKQKRDELNCP